ncbi:hypothetical protein K488DRAFT_90244, partial [Vararia minispora EC-137]
MSGGERHGGPGAAERRRRIGIARSVTDPLLLLRPLPRPGLVLAAMSASAPTMKTIHKRLYTVLPRGVTQAAAAAAAAASSASQGRLRSNSASSSRSFYSAPSPSPNALAGLAGFFDAAPPPSPARAQLSSSRLPVDARAELETPPSPTHHHHGH